MKILGIPLRRPSFTEVTGAAAMGTGLWLGALGVMEALRMNVGAEEAGALLLVVMWGCVSVRVGIHVGDDRRHLVANVTVSAALLGLYKAAMVLLA